MWLQQGVKRIRNVGEMRGKEVKVIINKNIFFLEFYILFFFQTDFCLKTL